MNKLKVLLADDHESFRKTVATFLSRQETIEVVAEASTGYEAIEQTERHNPDLVLMDVHMPNVNGVEATRTIKRRHPKTRVVMLTFDGKESVRVLAAHNFADGFIEKGDLKQGLLRLIGFYAAGGSLPLASQAA